MNEILGTPRTEKPQIAVIPDVVMDPLCGWAFKVKVGVVEAIREHGAIPLIVPIHDADGNIDTAAHAYVRMAFDFQSILASEALKSEMDTQWSLQAVKDYTENVAKTRHESASVPEREPDESLDADIVNFFDPRVLVVPDFKNGIIHLSRRFVDALRIGSKVIPVISCGAASLEDEMYYAEAAGILIPGSYTNYHPKHYGGTYDSMGDMFGLDNLYDMDRDRLVKACVEHSYAQDLPLFGICSGMQGIAVFGPDKGRLIQDLKAADFPGHCDSSGRAAHDDFREASAPVFMPSGYLLTGESSKTEKFKAAHHIKLKAGAFLTHLLSLTLKVKASDQHPISTGYDVPVNSIHQQAVEAESIGKNLSIEAVAEDGIVEALHDRSHNFLVGVQFHPEAAYMKGVETHPLEKKLYTTLFWAFGKAASEKLWRTIIGRRIKTGNWRNRGMPRVYMTVPGSIKRTPEFVTSGGVMGTLLNLSSKPPGNFLGG